MDAKKTMVDRSSLAGSSENVHVGRLFVMRERSTDRHKLAALQPMAVPQGTALPPEDNDDIKSTVCSSMLPGSVGSGDGGQAIKSSVKASAGGAVPLIYAQHGKKPKAQYTKHSKLDVASLAPELLDFFAKQGRVVEGSSSVRLVAGNQGAESLWGTSANLLTQLCMHRGMAKRNATANALCCIFLSQTPGLKAFGQAWAAFLRAHVDTRPAKGLFNNLDWCGMNEYLGVAASEPKRATPKKRKRAAVQPAKAAGLKKKPSSRSPHARKRPAAARRT